jgi:hypothetical protein
MFGGPASATVPQGAVGGTVDALLQIVARLLLHALIDCVEDGLSRRPVRAAEAVGVLQDRNWTYLGNPFE